MTRKIKEIVLQRMNGENQEEWDMLYSMFSPLDTEEENNKNLEKILGYHPEFYYLEKKIKNIFGSLDPDILNEFSIKFEQISDIVKTDYYEKKDAMIMSLLYSTLCEYIDNEDSLQEIKNHILIDSSVSESELLDLMDTVSKLAMVPIESFTDDDEDDDDELI